MKASELRIGNIIHQFSRIEASNSSDFTKDILVSIEILNKIDCKYSFIGYEPIPLTEEWLVKFGINNVSVTRIKCYQTILGYYNITIEDNIFKFWISDCDDCRFALDIKYVHQLQNLYFALTGEELTIPSEKK